MSFKYKLPIYILVVGGLFIGLFRLFVAVNSWFESHYFQFNQLVVVRVNKPVEIKEREVEVREMVKVIETIPAPQDLKTDIEKYIYEVFGIENYRIAIAVSKCEGLNHPPDGFNVNNNGSIDVGYMRINSVNFDVPGCSLKEVADPFGNIDCGHKIWDRADGVEGNNKGSFGSWVGFTNGCAVTKL